LQRIKSLPREILENPAKLVWHLYGETFYLPILEATNLAIHENIPNIDRTGRV
jgi:hypothetical protein